MTDQHDALSTEVLADLMTLHGRATPGTWAQGTSSHHTVSKREGKEDYHVANFHHADDASFIDNAHKYMPLLIEEIHRLRSSTQPTKPEQQAGGVPAGWKFKLGGTGVVIVSKEGVGGYVADINADSIASAILAHLTFDILAAPSQSAVGKP